ncbi:MAG: Ppx/GppA phosphatase family protein [Acidimicrobiia bacterium]
MTRRAAIDLGSNSTRLLIANVENGGSYVTVERLMQITRMGAGVDADGRLAADAIARVEACLHDFRTHLDAHGPCELRVVATSAARDAANREALFDRVEAILGLRPVLLTGQEEAALSYRGATASLPQSAPAPYLVVDIGGGSTEFVLGIDEPIGASSVDMGCVRFTERFIESDPPRGEELSNAVGFAKDFMADVLREIPDAVAARTLIGLAGTVSAAVRIFKALPDYDRDAIHHAILTREDVEEVFREVATATHEERLATPGMEPERADVIVGGMCVLVAIMRTLGSTAIVHSEADILDGLVMESQSENKTDR